MSAGEQQEDFRKRLSLQCRACPIIMFSSKSGLHNSVGGSSSQDSRRKLKIDLLPSIFSNLTVYSDGYVCFMNAEPLQRYLLAYLKVPKKLGSQKGYVLKPSH